MSIGQLMLIIFWLVDALAVNRDLKSKLKTFVTNPAALILASLFFIHILGMAFTVDFEYGWKDLRTKLPLLALPIIISSIKAPTVEEFKSLIWIYITACFTGTLLCVWWLATKDIDNIRDIVWFNSHIRFALNIAFSFFICLIFFFRCTTIRTKIFCLILIVWFPIYLVLQESITGLGVMITTSSLMILITLFRRRKFWISIPVLLLLILVPLSSAFYLKTVWNGMKAKEEKNLEGIDRISANGNIYYHDTTHLELENGYYVGLYQQPQELKDNWNKRSDFDFDGIDNRNQQLKFTLIRYLTSKGLRKDSVGVAALSAEDIKNIEHGYANYKHAQKTSLRTRIEIIFWEYQRYKTKGEISGHSLTQRFEFWRASWYLIKRNFWFGVGTGDMNIAFEKAYDEMNSQLSLENRHRSHNQYLSIFTALGVFGILWFIYVLVWPAVITGSYRNYLYLSFFFILIISMLFEDTIETQAGVTFYAFLSSFLIFSSVNFRKDLEKKSL